MKDKDQKQNCGFVAVLGAPNAGKSTLTNALVGEHVSIVSSKVQTTRFPVQGIYLGEHNEQVVLVDTPGIFDAKKNSFDDLMVKSAVTAKDDADLIILVVDAARARGRKPTIGSDAGLAALSEADMDIWLVFNKIDLLSKEDLLKLSADWNATYEFGRTYFISAAKNQGVDDLKQDMAGAMPEGPWLFPEDDITDLPIRLYAAERTREAAFERLHKELPYNLAVVTEDLENRDDIIIIKQVIFIKQDKHKAIILGKGGQTIKAIGSIARRALEKDLGKKVHLELFVKEKKNWDSDRDLLASWRLGE